MENEIIDNMAVCPNCKSEMAITDKYCPSCGQKVQRKIPKVLELLGEFFDSVLNIDSKIFLTFRSIFIPGRLTLQYFKGVRKRYYHPFRLFFFVTVLFFTALGLTGLKASISKFNDAQELREIREKVQTEKQLALSRDKIVAKFEDTLAVKTFYDSLQNEFALSSDDSLSINIAGEVGNYKIASNDMLTLTGDEIIEKYEIEGFWDELFAHQVIKTVKDPSGFVWYMMGNFIWMLIFLIPAVAMVLKLLYIRRKRYYVEHLTFLFHFHAFTFFLGTLFIIAAWYFKANWLYIVLWAWVTLYLFIAMKRFYKQKWFKTVLKFFMMGFSYLFLSVIFFVFLTIISLAMF